MSRAAIFPLWVFVAVAAVIAGIGFAIGQIFPEAEVGVLFVASATSMWVAHVADRDRRARMARVEQRLDRTDAH